MRWDRALNTRLIALGSAAAAAIAFLRGRYLRWGATDEEANIALAGDELLPDADLTATRAVTVRAAGVWPWIVQLGQGRGGFYSYDFLENLVGCDIHSADRIVPEWQAINVGDHVNLHPEVGLLVALVEPERVLVLRGGVPMGRTQPPYDFTWAFILRLLVEPVELISFVGSQRMLRGIRERAGRAVVSTRDLGEQ